MIGQLAAPGTRIHDANARFGAATAILLDRLGLAAELIEPFFDRWVRNREVEAVETGIAVAARSH